MASAAISSTSVQQQQHAQPLPVAEKSFSIDARTFQAAKRVFTVLAVLALLPVITFTAITLAMGAGYHMILTVPISLFFLGVGLVCLAMRQAIARHESSAIDYNNPKKLQQYRKEAAELNFDQLLEKHGLKNLIKYQIVTKQNDLQAKFDVYLRTTPLREVIQLDIPLLFQAGLIHEPFVSKWQELKEKINLRLNQLKTEESNLRNGLETRHLFEHHDSLLSTTVEGLRQPWWFTDGQEQEERSAARQRCEADIEAMVRAYPSAVKVKRD
jgi:hypothetical protein